MREPGAVTINYVRDGKPGTAQIVPRFDEERQRYRLGLAFGGRQEQLGPVESVGASLSGMWTVTTATVQAIAGSSTTRGPQGGLRRRRFVRGNPPVDLDRSRPDAADHRVHLAVARGREPVPVPASRRWSHLLGDRGEAPRWPARGDATLERASLIGIMLVAVLFLVGSTTTSRASSAARASASSGSRPPAAPGGRRRIAARSGAR